MKEFKICLYGKSFNIIKDEDGFFKMPEELKKYDGFNVNLKPAHEPMVLARKPLSEKTVAENVLKWGTGAINIDECRVACEVGDKPKFPVGNYGTDTAVGNIRTETRTADKDEASRWPANLIHDGSDEVQSIFPDTLPSKKTYRGKGIDGALFKNPNGFEDSIRGHNDNGGNASRYFYCAKASKKDRNDGLDGFEEKRPDTRTESGMGSFDEKGVAKQKNHHPTVKPTDLMQYLVKLITPKGGTVLDPFNGSGSTGKACAILKDRNYKYIGIDLSQEYLDISKARIENEINKK